MENAWQWLTGTAIGLAAVISGVILRDRQVLEMIRQGDAALSERINETRDEFVRKDDLDRHMRSVEKAMDEIKAEMREQRRTNERLDATLIANNNMIQTLLKVLRDDRPSP